MGFLRNPVKSIQGTVNQVGAALKPLVAPIEKAAAVTVSAVAGTFGIPVSPSMVNQIATGVKVNTYAKPSGGGSAASPAPAAALPSVPANVPSTSFWDNLTGMLQPAAAAPVGTSALMTTSNKTNPLVIVGALGLIGLVVWKVAK